ncbi:MAG: nucleotidyltransferase domain-containing protein [Thermanaeromonas sp.]|uniref:type VII toxin-antitoxin system MntA family adenylyltransferase antitoxin n=1 Tax=Thermanaeromonas sp. TaxID=2003697 RepID=UPI00243B96DC|nr:nucleotidyltransferase domain-containing protein [Thermanaeromonas sp.]MCG0278346.1 nucleotidyltransferase domain-containing protein [Thermanaeromonas sp.]
MASLRTNLNPFMEKVVMYLQQCPDVAAAYLFGSYARGTERQGSDIDIAVLFYNLKDKLVRFDRRLEMIMDLEGIVVGRKVDVVDIEEAPLLLQHYILKEGILLVDKEPRYRISFEVKSRRSYFDLRPLLVKRGQRIIERVLGGILSD